MPSSLLIPGSSRVEQLLFTAMQWLLMRIVRFKSFPDSAGSLNLDPDKPVFYALQIRQFSALLVLDEAMRQIGLPAATTPLRHESAGDTAQDQLSRIDARLRVDERSRFFFLTRRGQPSPLRPNPYRYSDRLLRLVQAVAASRGTRFDIQLVPVSIFWGRAPNHQDSALKALFADNWVTPGFFTQILRLLIHGRQTILKFGAPISVRDALTQGGDTATSSESLALRRIARLLRAEFKRERELAIGPDLSHRHTMVNRVIASSPVQRAIGAQMTRSGADREAVELQARRLAVEIAADYSYPFIRIYDRVLAALWNRIYDGIEVHGFEDVSKLGAGAEIIYLPCHRSHIDYLLLSYVIYHRGLQPPHVAAGDNLNLPLIGGLLRRGGAFFLRRSFKGEALYGEVFKEYLHAVIERGFPIEYFIEGGRSRTGRMLAPKTGLLAMTVQSWQRDGHRPIVFIPVYIGYERLIEGDSYFAELSGQPKKRETLFGLVSSLRALREHFGKVQVNIGEPIRLEALIARDQPDSKPAVDRVAKTIVARINAAVVVNPINLLALALTSPSRSAMDERELSLLLDQLHTLLQRVPYSDRQQLNAVTGSDVIDYAIGRKLIVRIEHPLGNIIQASDKQARRLSYFRNNVMHALAVPSLIAALVARNDAIERSDLLRIIAHLYPFLRADWFLWREPEQLPDHVEHLLECLTALRLVRDNGTRLRAAPAFEAESAALQQLAAIIRPSLERYCLAVTTLARVGSTRIGAVELENTCFLLAQRVALLHPSPNPEFFDRRSFRAIVATMRDLGHVHDDDGLLVIAPAMLAVADDAQFLLPAEIRLALHQVAALSQDDIGKAPDSRADRT